MLVPCQHGTSSLKASVAVTEHHLMEHIVANVCVTRYCVLGGTTFHSLNMVVDVPPVQNASAFYAINVIL